MKLSPINFGLLTASDGLYLLVKAAGYEEDDVYVLYGSVSNRATSLHEVLGPEDIVSMVALQGDGWDADAAALSIDGEVFFLNKGQVTAELLRTKKDSEKFLGHMRTLKQCGDNLYALGYGGQIYRRGRRTEWEAIHNPAWAGQDYCFLDAIETKDGVLFCGTQVAGVNTDLMTELVAITDPMELATRLISMNRRDQAILWRLGAQWQEVQIPGNAERCFALTTTSDKAFAWTDDGVFKVNDEVLTRNEPLSALNLDFLSGDRHRTLGVQKGVLGELTSQGFAEVAAMPKGSIVSISLTNQSALAVSGKKVFCLEDGAWAVLGLEMA